MTTIFNVLFYQPILNLLVFLYNTISFQDLGVAIILLTTIIKLVFWPLGRSAIKSQKALQELQPKIDDLKKQYSSDPTELSRATMELYKNNKINPFSSCLPLLIQIPFLFAVYRVFRDGLVNKLGAVYPFIYKPATINAISFGFLDLTKPNVYLAVLAGLAQFWQAKMMITTKPSINTPGSKDESMAAIMNKQMLYFMPAITIFIGLSLPGGLTFYWFVLTLITVIQQLITFKRAEVVGSKNVIEGEIKK